MLRLGDDAYGVPDRAGSSRCTRRREVSLANVYATLERLQEKGYVSSELADPTPERGGRAKRYFSVTAQGLKKVRETQRTSGQIVAGVPDFKGIPYEDAPDYPARPFGCWKRSR